MVERVLCMHKVRGSIPCVSIFLFSATVCSLGLAAPLQRFGVRLVPARQCERRRDPRAARDGAPVRSRSTRISRTSRQSIFVRARPNRACPPSFFARPTRSPGAAPLPARVHLAPTPRVAVFELAKMRPAYGVGSRARARAVVGAGRARLVLDGDAHERSGRRGRAAACCALLGGQGAAGRDAHTESADAGDLEGARGGNRDARAGAGDAAEGRDADCCEG